jgi:hypothetical protein
MARLVLALLALTAVNASHCFSSTAESYCCTIGCDSANYGTHPNDKTCGGTRIATNAGTRPSDFGASPTTLADVFWEATQQGCGPLTEGSCAYGPLQETDCVTTFGFSPTTQVGVPAPAPGQAHVHTDSPTETPTIGPTPTPTVSPTTYPTFPAAFIASKFAAAQGNASSGHAL